MHARRELLAVLAAFALCAAGLSILHERTRHHYSLPAATAIADARANPADRAFLADHSTNRARVIPLDSSSQRVTFFDGQQVVLDAAVNERGEVSATEEHVHGAPASGATLANSPWFLALLSCIFLAATMVVPLRRARNLDALVLASLSVTVVLVNDRLAGASALWASAGLLYLIVRCLFVGLREGEQRREGERLRGDERTRAAAPPCKPLLTHVCARLEPRRRVRLLRLAVGAAAVAFVMITLTSGGYTDVASASLQGATELLHGTLPYGHITLALHGDTYPLLNYVLYAPAALWQPVTSAFSSLQGSLTTTAVASLVAAGAMYRLGGSDRERGLRLALAWLCFPPVLLAASGGANDLLVAACLAWALALRPRMGASLLALAMGAWVKLVPLILIVLWLPLRRRDLPRALAPAAALTLVLGGLLVGLGGGAGAIGAMLKAMSFQFQRGSFFAPWYTFDVQWLQPLVQAGVLAMALAIALRMRAEPHAREDVVRVSALAGALLLGLQLSANYWTWSYLPWVLPFLVVGLFAREGSYAAAPTVARSTPMTFRRRESALKAKALVSSME